jgi:SAM-dependent methyltransferase
MPSSAPVATARSIRKKIFATKWPLDSEVTAAVAETPSHAFLGNPASQLIYLYLTQLVRAISEQHFSRPFGEIDVLDWGCGKGHITKWMRDLKPHSIISCDVEDAGDDDSAFGQATPLIEKFRIAVDPLQHPYEIPYADAAFDVVISMGVLEHVPDDRASLHEVVRILRPGGLFFCFFLPATLSWTQKIAHMRGNNYHDRLYDEPLVDTLSEAGLSLVDFWHRQILPKNTIKYPQFRLFERFDQAVTEHTPLRRFATNIEFIAAKPR